MTKETATIDEWLDEVRRLFTERHGDIGYDLTTSSWENYYEDGYTPRDAICEDESYWAGDSDVEDDE